MSNEKFTPGKWEVKEYDEIFIVAGQRHIAMMKDNGLYLPWSESQANANLIAASPLMYEALNEALFYLKLRPKTNTHIISKIESALLKATPQEPPSISYEAACSHDIESTNESQKL